MYAWGSTDNTYTENGQNTSVKITLKSADGIAVTKVAIFPNDNIDINGRNAKDFVEYKTGDDKAHQPYSGEYAFATNNDGSATLTVNKLYRNNNMAAAGYAANRCIYVYGMKDGQEVLLYKTNIARAATLVPPKKTGSFVLRYDQKLEDKDIREKLQQALDAPTAGKDGKSLRDQIKDASTAKGVGVRDENTKKLDVTPDTAENKVIINAEQAYDVNQVNSINTVTSASGAAVTTYKTGVYNLKTYLVSDLGYKSEAIALTIARYDTRIDKPTVEDPTNVSQDIKTDIIKKLARLNHVGQDKVSINDKGEVSINFEGVDEKDAPKIPLRDLVLKKIEEKDISVPAADKAVFVANPLGYSNAELDRIKTAIFEANKDNKELGLTSKDQITLEYLKGDLTATGDSNKGISNGQAENKITVKIKTDKSVAEFTSNVKENKLTKLPDIRKDYDVSWTKTKIDGRDTDEGISWSNDQKTTIIYRYDPTKAEEFDTTKILGLLKATPKDKQAGLRDLTGGEQLSYEGTGTHSRKSHMNYALQNEEPTGELVLGNMSGAYWQGNQKVSNSDVDLGDNLSDAGSYSWDTEAGSVTVAAKKGKIFKARLFVEPYAMTYYKHVYLEQGRNPGNTAKAINVIFVPQTNHKKDDLSKSIDEHKLADDKKTPTEAKYYNASADKKEAYDKALKTAKDLLDTVKDKQEKDLTEEQKAQIDNATINLNKARAELDGPDTNKDGLKKSIDANGKAAEGSTAATGTQATNQFKNVSDPDFKKADGSDDTERNEAAKKAKADYDKALEEAEKVNKDANATQKAVDDAKAALDNARKALDAYNTDTTKLKDSVDKHGSTDGPAPTEGTQTSDAYRNASDPHFLTADGKPDEQKNKQAAEDKKAYDEALTKAQELLKKHDDKDTPLDAQPTQKEIDDALKALDEARKKLEDNYKTVTTDLETEINKSTPEGAPAVTENDFENTPEFKNAKAKTSDGNENADVTAYKEALKKARELVKAANPTDPAAVNSSHPTQQQINDALDALKAAKKQIEDNYKTNLEPLTSAKDFAGGDFKKTPEYQNAVAKKAAGDQGATNDLGKDGEQTGFDNVLKKVTEKLNDEDWKKKATQKDVSALLKQLKDAQDKIAKTYKTDAIKLEREVGDKDQDGKPVTPPFEASVPYKNALAKSNDGDNDATAKLNAYNEKLKAAQDLINKVKNPDPNAAPADRPTQQQVDQALTDLQNAKKAIDENFKTKVDKLQNEVDDKNEDGSARTPKFEESTEFANLQGKTKDGKKPDDLVAYEQALAKAKELIDKNDGKVTKDGQEVDVPKDQLPTQVQVDEAQKALKEIKDKILANYKTNPHDLQEEVDMSKDGDDDQRDTTFENTPEFKNADSKKGEGGKDNDDMAAYKTALDAAKKLLDKFDRTTGKPKTDLPAGEKAPTQKQLDDALDALQAAKKKITDGYKTDPSKLKSEADADGDFTKTPEYQNAQAKGDDASKQALEDYKKALEDANKVLGDKNATQAQVDEALQKLQAAKQKLTDAYKTDTSGLVADVNGAVGVNDSDYRNASREAREAYDRALAAAQAVLNNPRATQAEVDAARLALKNAADALMKSAHRARGAKHLAQTSDPTQGFAVMGMITSAFGLIFAGAKRKHQRRQ